MRAEEIVTEHTKDFWDGEYDAKERAALVAAINQAFEEACRAVCDDCAKGVPLSDPEHHTEAGGFYPCDAAPIRRLMCDGMDAAALAKTGERRLLNQAEAVECVEKALRAWDAGLGRQTPRPGEQVSEEYRQTTREVFALIAPNVPLLRRLLNTRPCHEYIRPKIASMIDLSLDVATGKDMGGWWVRAPEYAGRYLCGGPCSVPDELAKWVRQLKVEAANLPPNVRAALTGAEKRMPAPRGRKKLDAKESQRRLTILGAWDRAKSAGITREQFCRDQNPPITVDTLEKYQRWASMRRQDNSAMGRPKPRRRGR